ncbi:ABC transporter ATP-binding protein [Clostridium butyricum]|jgi:ATP-binding cassette subfamily B protein|uniref:ABC transporter, ATP-binding/permease protein n=2 Tax=Clostridium butyricum TaxID=1492 RepID=C4IIP3_CLOBU|nr:MULTISPECIES: ABC transporter ATP-binding protein [Clostridium]ETI90647.1 MAG: ABC-type multidrug/protein/lipid transport system, ATPase component [Clostridium butyricum DORA_1]EDT76843.1 ABC-type multidrug/protein/lipid transport system, ATPase component [Clostridium butyricum 5521]EEP54155.1 ABC transporter, ATP-binding/permease protein [Clostridium butyricum E4 str. BoNT E BL5262]MBO1685652.1 ABC transporter ATP-binding protein [Clostridium butyricum]MDU1006180.1 ABC transporter ATP-bind
MSEKRSGPPMGGPMGMGGKMGGGAKAKDFKKTMMDLIHYLEDYKGKITAVIILAAFSSLFSIVGPKILGKATTKLFEGLIAYLLGTNLLTDFPYIRNCIISLVVLYLISALFAYIQGYIMSGVSMNVTYKLRKEISHKMNKLPLKYFDTRTHGEVLSRITNDVDTVSQTLNQSLSQIITSTATVIGVLIMMLSISVLMTFVAFLVIPLSGLLIMGVVKKSQKYFKQQQKSLGSLNGHIEEIYSGHNIVQVFNGEKEAIETFTKINDDLYTSAWKSQFLSGMMMPIMSFIGNLGYVAVCILGGYLAVKKTIDVGDIQSFIQYVRSFTQPIAQLANISNTLQSTAAAAERVFEFLNEEEEVPDTSSPIKLNSVVGNVEFKNVHFGYTEDKIIINNFSSYIKSGQRIAIVGPTGAGKSTIIKLLMRFYDINSGEILIDGHSIKDYTRNDLREIFGMVLQDTWLYNASIFDNIKYGNFDATKEDVINAAKAAHCDEFIKALPNGYNLILNEEANNISQGQKQLLTIARTILSDPKILILDEATSSVDTRTEVLIQKAMDHLMNGRTSFIIAHRLSTIKDADIILVMKDGDIIEQGSHDELLKTDGFYAHLYNSQFDECEQ